MKCERCGNEDSRYFSWSPQGWYCRKCLRLSQDSLETWPISHPDCEEYCLSYSLSSKQQEISHLCRQAIETQDVLLRCVCGAGKTEMVLETIQHQLEMGKVVGFAIPRKEVVLELAERLQSIFTKASVIAVFGGHTQQLTGDIVVCTTHQLFRYQNCFDVLILDEPDAFPFKGNSILWSWMERAKRGHVLFLSATPNEEILNRPNLRVFRLDRRPHGHPLVVPKKILGPKGILCLSLLFWLRKRKDVPVMLFFPSISLAKKWYWFLRKLFSCRLLTSQSEDKEEVVIGFKNRDFSLLLCTTVMERGITITGVDVCVYLAEHKVFDEASLIQMAGRVGRKFSHPSGTVLFLCAEKSLCVNRAIESIMESNALSSL